MIILYERRLKTYTENDWICELDVEESIDIPIFIKVGFMPRDHFHQQHQNNDTLY